jgi:hypothetical protein
MSDNYIFNYRVKGKSPLGSLGAAGNIISILIFIIASGSFVVFLMLAFKTYSKYIWLANFSGLIALFFGPYAYFSKKNYYFALHDDNILIMKSMIKFIPRTYKIDLSQVTEITYSNPIESISVLFKDGNGKVLGKFNYVTLGGTFKKCLDIICEKNKQIKCNAVGQKLYS